MFLLDTNVVSELRKIPSGRANPGVVAWASATPASSMFLSVISLHELEAGVALAERSDPAKGQLLRGWLNGTVIPGFANRIVSVDETIALRSAALHVPDPAPYRDAFIGATALVHGLTVVTRNVADFARFDAAVVANPWT